MERLDITLEVIAQEGYKNGIETAEIIQSIYDIPVNFMAANISIILLERIIKTKTYSYLYKSFNFESLLSAINFPLYYRQSVDNIFTDSSIRTPGAERIAQHAERGVQWKKIFYSSKRTIFNVKAQNFMATVFAFKKLWTIKFFHYTAKFFSDYNSAG